MRRPATMAAAMTGAGGETARAEGLVHLSTGGHGVGAATVRAVYRGVGRLNRRSPVTATARPALRRTITQTLLCLSASASSRRPDLCTLARFDRLFFFRFLRLFGALAPRRPASYLDEIDACAPSPGGVRLVRRGAPLRVACQRHVVSVGPIMIRQLGHCRGHVTISQSAGGTVHQAKD